MVLGTPTSETPRWRRTTIPSATDCLLTALWCKGYQTHACSEPDYLVTDYPPITSGNRCRTNRVCFCQLCALQGGLLRLLTKRRKTFPGFPRGKKRVRQLGISVLFGQELEAVFEYRRKQQCFQDAEASLMLGVLVHCRQGWLDFRCAHVCTVHGER